MLKKVLAALLVVFLFASPAAAEHVFPSQEHWPGTGVRQLAISDVLVHYIPVEQRDEWRQFRTAAISEWEKSGAVTFSVTEKRTRKQLQWDGVCAGKGARDFKSKGRAGGADIVLCRHGDWAAQAFGYVDAPCTAGTTTCHFTKVATAINEGFAGTHPKYVAHELGHNLGLNHRGNEQCDSVMSYCSGDSTPDAHDLEAVAMLHGHDN